MMKKRARVKM